jgi:hypothetical protein
MPSLAASIAVAPVRRGALRPLAPDVWIVDDGPIHPAGLEVPIRMTVLRLGDGALWLHSPTPFRESLRRSMEREGPIRHLVAPNSLHWTFVADWRERCPEAVVWAAPGLPLRPAVRRSGLVVDRELGDAPPPAWAGAMAQVVLPAAVGFREVAFFHRPSRTLLLTDFVANLEPSRLPPATRAVASLAGVVCPHGRTGLHLRLATRPHRDAVRAAAERLLALRPERVLFAHGRWFEYDATARLRQALAWLLD